MNDPIAVGMKVKALELIEDFNEEHARVESSIRPGDHGIITDIEYTEAGHSTHPGALDGWYAETITIKWDNEEIHDFYLYPEDFHGPTKVLDLLHKQPRKHWSRLRKTKSSS